MEIRKIEIRDGLIVIVPTAADSKFEQWLSASDREYIAGLALPRRRTEAAAWRAAVRMEGIAGDIVYNAVGAPVMPENDHWSHMGVTHSCEYAAVIFSRQPCAIDMERTDRDFSRAAPRFISEAETCIPGSENSLFMAAVWCAKETLYKLSGREGLDLLGDLRIISIDFRSGTIMCSIRSVDDQWTEYAPKMLLFDSCLLVYTAETDGCQP